LAGEIQFWVCGSAEDDVCEPAVDIIEDSEEGYFDMQVHEGDFAQAASEEGEIAVIMV
jgi:hypothetical protein